ncbi:MAG: pyridoxamine 5'-phosphate oxidase family protein [Terrimesophilobacter sp.]
MAAHSNREVEHLSGKECWRLLSTAPIGRLATAVVDAANGELFLDVFPVNFLVHEEAIYFRTGPGSKLMEITSNNRVAFEADHRSGSVNWSVVVHGRARRVMMDREIEESGVLELEADHPTDKWNYVCVTVDSITGSRFSR